MSAVGPSWSTHFSITAVRCKAHAEAERLPVCPDTWLQIKARLWLCKAEGANRVTISNAKWITAHLLLKGTDGLHFLQWIRGVLEPKHFLCLVQLSTKFTASPSGSCVPLGQLNVPQNSHFFFFIIAYHQRKPAGSFIFNF